MPTPQVNDTPRLRRDRQQWEAAVIAESQRIVQRHDTNPQQPVTIHTKQGKARLRGIPVIADGVGGTQLGSDPLAALLAKEQAHQHDDA